MVVAASPPSSLWWRPPSRRAGRRARRAADRLPAARPAGRRTPWWNCGRTGRPRTGQRPLFVTDDVAVPPIAGTTADPIEVPVPRDDGGARRRLRGRGPDSRPIAADLPTDRPADLPPDMAFARCRRGGRPGPDDSTPTPPPTARTDPRPPASPCLTSTGSGRGSLGDVNLGRLAVVSVGARQPGVVQERLGYVGPPARGDHAAPAHGDARVTSSPTSTASASCACAETSGPAAAESLAEPSRWGVAHPSVVLRRRRGDGQHRGALAGHLDERPESVLARSKPGTTPVRSGCPHRDQRGPCDHDDRRRRAAAGIARDELVLHYLPLVSCATGRVAASRRSCAGTTLSTECCPVSSCRAPNRPA